MPAPKKQHSFSPMQCAKLEQTLRSKNADRPHMDKLVLPHIESFNDLTNDYINGSSLFDLYLQDISPVTFFDHNNAELNNGLGNKVVLRFGELQLTKPIVSEKAKCVSRLVYPTEARERLTSYRGRLQCQLCISINDNATLRFPLNLGHIPIMVRSNVCNLYALSPLQLVENGEEPYELGGYFIVNGIERIIRMLLVGRRNYPMALIRPSFCGKGPLYSHFGIQIRCVRADQTAQTNFIHYLNDGSVMFRVSHRRQEFLVPVMLLLGALEHSTNKQIYDAIAQGSQDSTFVSARIEALLLSFKKSALYTRESCLAYLGSKFHHALGLAEDLTDVESGLQVLDQLVLVHLTDVRDKFSLLTYMLKKLYALVAGECAPDNPDSPQFQEILLGGHLYGSYLKEKLSELLFQFISAMNKERRMRPNLMDLSNHKWITRVISKVSVDMGKKLEYFISTGNIVSTSGMNLPQMSGYTVVAEKISFYRYISHFRCVHRGSFFAELKTTSVRKLLPEAWGFLCPVHTPDGAPCGLLNHLSHTCTVTTKPTSTHGLASLLLTLGMTPAIFGTMAQSGNLFIHLDGKILGHADPKTVLLIAETLRHYKATCAQGVASTLEIGNVSVSSGGQYPGLYLFSNPARMMRPVKYIGNPVSTVNESEPNSDWVGTFEQVYMDIACLNKDVIPGVTTHIEHSPLSMLSIVANLTPFSDFNQSPRNMYQCQMGKQTMGIPSNVINRRTDNKLYCIQTPQTPIVRPKLHDHYAIDDFPLGTNAVIAVISYTSYDMEDAMIINKMSHERGFGYGTIFKSQVVDLEDYKAKDGPCTIYFALPPTLAPHETLDLDGMPQVGVKICKGQPIACIMDELSGKHRMVLYKGLEEAFIDQVRLLGSDLGDASCMKILIKLRIPRPPLIGDKFSSRHGQKGVCSQKWPHEDMPFSETGIIPDVIINPHAFPSRMTIGMFIEQMAAKSGALHGICQDATPFQFDDDQKASSYFGEQLASAGFSYHGNEPMYSGTTGQEMKADIYLGIVYYQRLRHMVLDKFQVRTTGPVNPLTMQPVGGRKNQGGIRFGEMERDSLLGHGVSFLLQDRLMNCSDYSQVYVCMKCESFLATMSRPMNGAYSTWCGNCKSTSDINVVAIPYVLRFLCTELVAMGVQMNLSMFPSSVPKHNVGLPAPSQKAH